MRPTRKPSHPIFWKGLQQAKHALWMSCRYAAGQDYLLCVSHAMRCCSLQYIVPNKASFVCFSVGELELKKGECAQNCASKIPC